MLEGIRRLFRKKESAPEPGSLVEELWLGSMTDPDKGRFLEAKEAGYSASYRPDDRLELCLERPGLFAWAEAPLYRHSDFVLEGEFQIEPSSPYSACGFLFRYQDEGNFYALLVSNRGYFRLDAVFNSTPRPLVAWTELPGRESTTAVDEFSLRLIAHGGHFTVIVDEAWVAEAADESFDRGHLAFAGQRYEDSSSEPARFSLLSCMVESRPIEVETWYFRWNYYIVPDPGARRRLAETFFAMGDSLAAAIQLHKIEGRRALDADELFLKAEASLRLGLQEEAEAALDACLALEPSRDDAAEEKANLLYLRGDYLELRELTAKMLPQKPDSARLYCLSGHARFNLGDFEGAALEYRSAADLALSGGGEGEQALYRMNEARSWDQIGRKSEAAAAYLAAARLFSAQEADDDLELALGRLASLKPRDLEVKAIRAKALFRAGKKEEASKLLSELVAKGSEDSSVHYSLGLLAAEKGQGEKALELFKRALELEGEYPLYAFRYAERLFLLGRESGEAIERALRLCEAERDSGSTEGMTGPEGESVEGWTRNLAGQEALGRGDLAEARLQLEKARSALPGRPEPAINLADLESREGKTDLALELLAAFPEDAACRNQAGNVLAKAGRLEEACREYLRATVLDPDSADYWCNLAATYLELERYSDAEAAIRRALDLGSPPRALLLAGNLAMVYGELPRAEASYRLGLDAAKDSGEAPALLAALGRCYLGLVAASPTSAMASRLESTVTKLVALDPEKGARLREEILAATTEALSCSGCGRIWRVPRDLPAQSASSIRGMPPDESPAGACPRCGKVFCIGCRKGELVENRFTCPDCGEALKLSDNKLRYLVREALRRQAE